MSATTKSISAQQLSKTIGVNRKTALLFQQKVRLVILETHYKPCIGKLNKAQLCELKTYIQSNLCRNSNQIRDHIEKQYGIIYTCDGIIALVHRIGFFYKKTRLIPSGCIEQSQLDWVSSFEELNSKLPDNEPGRRSGYSIW